MFISDEPGYYVEDEYGIRIENVVRVVKKVFEDKPEEGSYYKSNILTLSITTSTSQNQTGS